jgi:hypothetical protein
MASGQAPERGATHLGVVEGAGGTGTQDELPARLGLAIAALRARVEEEFRISERLDVKARQAFALSAALFAIAQTIALNKEVAGTEQVLLAVLALCAVATLGMTAQKLVASEELRREKDIDPAVIEEWARDTDDELFAQNMVVHLREVAERRAENNESRARLYNEGRGVIFWTRWTLILTGVELLFAVILRA